MAKAPKKTNSKLPAESPAEKKRTSSGADGKSSHRGNSAVKAALKNQHPDYLWSMSHAPRVGEGTHWFQLLPAAFFTALVILVVRMYVYRRPMDRFFWSNDTGTTDLSDFFSYFKMVAIVICAAVALVMILYRLCTQSLTVKRCFAYIPMGVYSVLVLLSYAFSEQKEFALWGWNDRFEGTAALLSYMIMLYFIINAVNSEKNVKFLMYPLIFSSTLLSLLGISQALDKDFFRTVPGQKLICPNSMTESGLTIWQIIDQAAAKGERFLDFTFKNKEIYQTVYNINYVSFYLTLLIPLFGMLFIRSINRGKDEPIWKKIGWGVLFALLIFNLIGSASSGGFLGLGVVGLIGIIILNKRIIHWWKPVVIMMALLIAVGGLTHERWMPEISGAINGVFGNHAQSDTPPLIGNHGDSLPNTEDPLKEYVDPGSVKPKIDYFKTNERSVEMSINGNPLTLEVITTAEGAVEGLVLKDADDNMIGMLPTEADQSVFSVEDDRFRDYMTISYAYDNDLYYILINTAGMQWPFAIAEDQIYYRNQLGKLLNLYDVPHSGWENNPDFGSGRGYIWSRTLPMMKDTLFLGYGADTYCIYFPHDDYAGKYTTNFQGNVNIVVDKPHNMYMGMAIGTGGLSLLAFLALCGIYFVQSIKIYFRKKFENDYLAFAGAGIFFGIVGFIVSAFVDDSSVSVMPLFYGLLGTGIAVNMLIERADRRTED